MANPTTPTPSAHTVSRATRQRRSAVTWLLFLLPALIVYVVFMAWPLVNSMRLSLYTGSGFRPTTFVGFDNYITLFTDAYYRDRFTNALGNTFIFFFIHMLVQNTLGLLFATLLASGVRGANTYRTIIFIPATLAVLVTGFLWRLILNPQFGALSWFLHAIGWDEMARFPWLGNENTVLPVVALVSSWQWVGLPTMMFLAGLLSIPDELLEAARIDGANSWELFWKIKVPLLYPVIGIVAVLTFVGNFNAFDVIFAMTGPRGDPLYAADLLAPLFYRVGIAGEHPVARPEMGMGAAVATMTFLILLAGVSLWMIFGRKRTLEM